MAVLLDIIGAGIIVGFMLLTMFGLNANLHEATYNKTFTLITQTNSVTLARMLEFDILKMGYHCPKSSVSLLVAQPDSISFRADLYNDGTIHTVKYYLGPPSALGFTQNPRDRMIYRVEDGVAIGANLGVTKLSFTYLTNDGIATAALSDIKSINVKFTVESAEPVDTSYCSTFWQKRIYPKNL